MEILWHRLRLRAAKISCHVMGLDFIAGVMLDARRFIHTTEFGNWCRCPVFCTLQHSVVRAKGGLGCTGFGQT